MRLPSRWLTLGVVTLACALLAGAAMADPPPNDKCSGAISIPCGNISLSGNTFTATNDYDFPDSASSCTGYPAPGRDVVYKFDAVAGDSVWLRYQSTADASFYIVTDCSNLRDSCKIGGDNDHQGRLETLNYGFKRTATYYLILDSYGADTYGNWTLVGQFLSCGLHPPVNDRCDIATPLFCTSFLYTGNTQTGFNDYSFPSIGSSCVGSLAQGLDVAFSLSVTAGDSLSVSYASSANGVMYIMPECTQTGAPVNCLTGVNATGLGGTETLNFVFTYTGTYYLILDSDGIESSGTWSLSGSLTCGLKLPTNDVCSTAAYLPCGAFNLGGDNRLAIPDYDPGPGTCAEFGAQGADVVYRIDAAPGDSLWCDYVFPHINGEDDVDAVIYLVTDCSVVDSFCVDGADAAGAAQIERLRHKFTTRGTYYMILDSYDSGISGIWTALGEFICPTALGVGGRTAPAAVSLSAAFPNPFELTSTLRFALPVASRATLRIHDLAGRVVRTLLAGELRPGSQSVTWDGRDDRGTRVQGGTYFARLMVGDAVAFRTLILVH